MVADDSTTGWMNAGDKYVRVASSSEFSLDHAKASAQEHFFMT